MNPESIDQKIERNIAHLKKLQKPDGTWADNNFIDALIARSLISVIGKNRTDAGIMLRKTAAHIFSQKSPAWSWNYHPRKEGLHLEASSYPDDMDDTFCSLIVLLKTKPELIDGQALTHIKQLLADTGSAGPYETWIGTKERKWNDIDPAVNANISYFLSLENVGSPKVTAYLDAVIRGKKYASRYYDNPLLITYFMSHGYAGKEKAKLVEFIYRQLRLTDDRTYRMLGLCSLLRLGIGSKKIQSLLKAMDRTDKNSGDDISTRKGNRLYIEKISGGEILHARSSAFDYAIEIEMYSLLMDALRQVDENKTYIDIKNKMIDRIKKLPAPARRAAERMMAKTSQTRSAKAAALFPFNIARSLGKTDASIGMACGTIGLFGWMAYSIYDSVLDEKSSQDNSRLLPIANIFHREMIRLASGLLSLGTKQILQDSKTMAVDIFFDMLNDFDASMYSDITRHRFIDGRPPRYISTPSVQETIDKSAGYMLPALLAFRLLHTTKSSEDRYLAIFLEELIFIRQMSDDIHDWKEDMAKGIMTRVSARILIIFQRLPFAPTHIDMARDETTLERIFSEHVLRPSIQEISAHIKKADTALHSLRMFADVAFFEGQLQAYKDSVRRSSEKLGLYNH